MNDKQRNELLERMLENDRKAKLEKSRQIAALYAEIAAADTEAVGLAFRLMAEVMSMNTTETELAKKALSSPAAMAVYDKLCNIGVSECKR